MRSARLTLSEYSGVDDAISACIARSDNRTIEPIYGTDKSKRACRCQFAGCAEQSNVAADHLFDAGLIDDKTANAWAIEGIIASLRAMFGPLSALGMLVADLFKSRNRVCTENLIV